MSHLVNKYKHRQNEKRIHECFIAVIYIKMWECRGSYGFLADWLPCVTIFQYINAKYQPPKHISLWVLVFGLFTLTADYERWALNTDFVIYYYKWKAIDRTYNDHSLILLVFPAFFLLLLTHTWAWFRVHTQFLS